MMRMRKKVKRTANSVKWKTSTAMEKMNPLANWKMFKRGVSELN